MSVLRRRPLLIAFSCILSSNQAFAQAVVSDQDQTTGPVGDIVVTGTRATTGTKTDTPIVDIPQSISVTSAEQIAARGAIGLQEALRYSPGIRTEPNGADYRFDYVVARGGFNAARYIDGMRMPDSSYTTRTEVFNLDRVEVLRGPSSVLYGQGAAGGIVNSITKRPEFATHGEVGVEYGSFDRKQVQADATGAVNAAGTVAGRLVVVLRDADNQVDFGKDNRVFVAPSLRFRPDDRTDIVLAGLYQRDRAASIASFYPLAATLLAPPGRRLKRSDYLGEPSLNRYDQNQASGTLLATHRLSDAVTFNGSVRYTRGSGRSSDIEPDVFSGAINPFLDPDNRVIGRVRYDGFGVSHTLTTDNNLRLEFDTGPFAHKVLIGVDYRRSRITSQQIYVPAGSLDIYGHRYDSANVPAAALEDLPRTIDQQLGFYVQDQIDFRDIASLLIGARRDRAINDTESDGRQIDRATTFRAGLTLHPTQSLSPYVSYSESFLPTIGLDFFGERFVPQRGLQYEAGVKWQPDRMTLLNIAAFSIKGTNLLQTDPLNGLNQIQIGTVRSRGLEIEGSRTIADNYTITASYSYNHARSGRSIDSLGKKLPISAVPTNQASLFGEKRFGVGRDVALRIGVGVRYIGPSREAAVFTDVVPDGAIESLKTPGFTLADALVAAEWRRWSASVNATNLFDKFYYAGCSPRSACSPGYGRNLIGTVLYAF